MFKNDPIKVARLKRRSNLWITPYMVKLMYEYDYVHAKVSDILLDQYRSPRKQSYKGKWIAYIYIYICMYIKVVSSKARSNPVNCDISPNRLDNHFISITKNLDNNIKNKPDTFLLKGPRFALFLNFVIYPSRICNALSNHWTINMEMIFWAWT